MAHWYIDRHTDYGEQRISLRHNILTHNILTDDILTYNIIWGDILQEERNKDIFLYRLQIDRYRQIAPLAYT